MKKDSVPKHVQGLDSFGNSFSWPVVGKYVMTPNGLQIPYFNGMVLRDYLMGKANFDFGQFLKTSFESEKKKLEAHPAKTKELITLHLEFIEFCRKNMCILDADNAIKLVNSMHACHARRAS